MELLRRAEISAKQTINPLNGEQVLTAQLALRHEKFDKVRRISPGDWTVLESALILSSSPYVVIAVAIRSGPHSVNHCFGAVPASAVANFETTRNCWSTWSAS